MSVDLISKYNSGVWKPLYCTTEKIVALALIALRKQPALIVVDSSFVWKKWVECIEKRLGIKAADVGKIADGRIRLGEKITVAMVQTLHKRTAEVAPHIGQLILDGSHIGRVTIMKYLETVEQFNCKYQLWLSSSSERREVFDEMIKWCVGPLIGQIDKKMIR